MKKYNKGGRRLKVYAQETSKVPAEEQQFTAQDSTDVAFFRTLSDVIKQNPLNLSEGKSEEEIDKFKSMWEKSKSMGEIEGLSEEQLKEKFPSLYYMTKHGGFGYQSPKGKFGSKKIDWSPIFKLGLGGSGKYPLVGEGEEGVLDPEFNKGGRVYAQETSKVPKGSMATGSQGYIEKFMEYLKGKDINPAMLGTGGGKMEEKSDMMKRFLDYIYSKSGAENIGAKFNIPNIEGDKSDTTSTEMKRTMTPLRPKKLQELIDKYRTEREDYEKELEQKEEYEKGGIVYAQETSQVPSAREVKEGSGERGEGSFTKSDTTSVVEYRNLFDHLGQDPVDYIFQYENFKKMDEMNPGFLDMIMEQKNLHLDMGNVEGAPSKEDLEKLKDPKKEYNMGGKTPMFMSNQSDMVGDFIYAQETSKVPEDETGQGVLPGKYDPEATFLGVDEIYEEVDPNAYSPIKNVELFGSGGDWRGDIYEGGEDVKDYGMFVDGEPKGLMADYINFMDLKEKKTGREMGTGDYMTSFQQVFANQWNNLEDLEKTKSGSRTPRIDFPTRLIGKDVYFNRDMTPKEAKEMMEFQLMMADGTMDINSVPDEYKKYFSGLPYDWTLGHNNQRQVGDDKRDDIRESIKGYYEKWLSNYKKRTGEKTEEVIEDVQKSGFKDPKYR